MDGEGGDEEIPRPVRGWCDALVTDARKRVVQLLSFSLSHLDLPLAMSLVDPDRQLSAPSTTLALPSSAGAGGGEGDEDEAGSPCSSSSSSSSSAMTLSSSVSKGALKPSALSHFFTDHDLTRLEMYSRNMVDHHLIYDLLPNIGKFGGNDCILVVDLLLATCMCRVKN